MPSPQTNQHPEAFRLANSEASVMVRSKELPLHCPQPGSSLWNSHPRVFIPLQQVGDRYTCPYCGTRYTLIS
jgi:uncharacterized Zn-finger protein